MEETINFWINGVCTSGAVIIGVVLNCVAISIIWRKYETANIFYQMLISLLCFDISVLVTWMNLSLFLAFKLNNDVILHMFPYFSYPSTQIAITASTFMTVAIAHERYLAVRDPMKYSQYMKTPHAQVRRLRLYLFIVIVISVAFNIPHFIELEVRYVEVPNTNNTALDLCHQNASSKIIASNTTTDSTEIIENSTTILKPTICYTALGENPYYLDYYRNWSKLMVTGVIPFLLLMFFNTYIYRAIKKNANRRQRLTSSVPPSAPQRLTSLQQSEQDHQSSIKTGKPLSTSTKRKDEENLSMVFVGIVTIFLLCHSLKIILNFYDGFRGKVGATSANRIAGSFSNFLVVLNSSINMIIYCILNAKFRNHFLNTIKHLFPCIKKKYVERTNHQYEGHPGSNPPKSTFRKCHFCQKHEHKLPIYCPVIPKMDYSTIKAIIKAHEITCNMCFGTDHKSLACIATSQGKLKKCSIQTKSGSICNMLHNKNIHCEKTVAENSKISDAMKQKYEIQVPWTPFQSKIFEELRPIHSLSLKQ